MTRPSLSHLRELLAKGTPGWGPNWLQALEAHNALPALLAIAEAAVRYRDENASSCEVLNDLLAALEGIEP